MTDHLFPISPQSQNIEMDEMEIERTRYQSTAISTSQNYPPSKNSENYKLPDLIAVAYSAVLEETIDELNIIGNVGKLPRSEGTLEHKTLEEMYGQGVIPSHIFDPETIEPFEVALAKQRTIKFQKDRFYVEQILKEAIAQLTLNRNYQTLVNHLTYNEQIDEQENMLLEEARRNSFAITKLKKLIEKERIDSTLEIQHTSEKIGQLKDEYEDLIFENGVKERYIDNWENSRLEMNNSSLDQGEEYYLNIINTSKTATEREIRIDAEIEAYITEVQQEYEDQIQEWMERYDKEIEIRDMEIQVLKEKREEQFMRLEQVAKLYEEHKLEIEQYLAVKEQRRLEEERFKEMTKAAIRIQAWWRGTMVRKHLGPYSKKKGKKGKKDKNKKGKK